MNTKILYIEDEQYLGRIVKESLEKEGYEVVWETDGARVMNHFQSFIPHLCVVDIMLPRIDGYDLCRMIRSRYPSMPVIFLTARTETADLVKGFEAGGTDYIKKPFSMEELLARITNQLALAAGPSERTDPVSEEVVMGNSTYFPQRYVLETPSGVLSLSQRENEILRHFAVSVNRVVDRRQLLLEVWGEDSFFNSRNLDVYVRKLRGYFSSDELISIQTLKGKGYLFLVKKE